MAFLLLVLASSLWITEAIPLAATSLLVAFCQPILGIQDFSPALSPFFNPVVMLLLGGFLLARAVEKSDLDEVFAVKIVKWFGVEPRMLTLGLMLTTAFLSMWISNTASTALMVSLALRLTAEVKDERGNFAKILVLGIAYSATAGGLATLIGTAPNTIAVAFLRDLANYELTFLGWSLHCLPITLISIFIIWFLLFRVFPIDTSAINIGKLQQRPLTRNQKLSLIVFVLAIVLWFSGQLPEPLANAIGWTGHGLSPSMVAALVAVVLFLIGVLDESDLSKISWSTLLLIGGGLGLGSALEVSGFVGLIAEGMTDITVGVSSTILVVVFGFAALGFSIIASNTASASIFIPIAISVGVATNVNPVILAVLVATCCNLDFMLPIGTPPNAIAYSTGKIRIKDMVKVGLLLDVLCCLLVIILAVTLWGFMI
jgi:sodium-dependent dicarboxylate transporter 2/3/5